MTNTVYTHEEAFEATKKYFNGDELATEVFLSKYALRNEKSELVEKTPTDMHKRLAKELARIEKKYPNPLSEQEIFDLLNGFNRGVAQGSPMAGIGNPYQTMSISNCFTIAPPEDSYGGICLTDQEEAQLMKRRGGVGFDLSTIRPKGMRTANAAGTTDGIGIFMERYSNTTREVAQNGRRGALMLTISVHHPEIETFINIKKDLKKVTGANISIRLTDEFLNSVVDNKDYELRWPVENKVNPRVRKVVNAKVIWDQIIDAAHTSAEPGLLFWDTVQRETPTECYEEYKSTSTNPCSEIVLSNYDSCRLFLINTMGYVINPFTKQAKFDYESYAKDVRISQRLMDDIVDIELECIDKILTKIDSDPEPAHIKLVEVDLWTKIREACVNGRRTGLGVTAVGDTVAALGLTYGSDQSIDFVENVYKELALNSYRTTVLLAKERGSFAGFDYEKEKNHSFLNRVFDLDPQLKLDWQKYGRRNIALTTTAPAGSVSILTQTTSGIEPVFMTHYTRRKKINPMDKDMRVDFVDQMGDKWQEYTVYHHGFKKWMEINNKTEEDFMESPYYKATSNVLDWKQSVKLQGVAQKWICHAISKTCNLPNEATKELVSDVYLEAWKHNCKGFTIYRDGSRSGVLVSSEKKEEKKDINTIIDNHAPKRPKELVCDMHSMTVKGEKWTFFVGMLNGRPYEILGGQSKFINIPKRVKAGKIVKNNGVDNPVARYDLHYDHEKGPEEETVIKDVVNVFDNATEAAFTRTISLSLRHGVPIQYIVEQISKGSEKDDDLFSFSKAVSRVLKQYIIEGTKSNKKCPQCSSDKVVYQEGCMRCMSCSYSKCT